MVQFLRFGIYRLTCLLVLSVIPILSIGQESESNQQLIRTEQSLLRYIEAISSTNDPATRNEINDHFLKALLESMEIPGALAYPFEKLHSISNLSNEKKDFRIFTWELENEVDEIRYHGVVAFTVDDLVEAHILIDSSFAIENGERMNLKTNKWYGALYYDLREFEYKKNKDVVLLGINRNEVLIKKKIIEIAEIDETLRFGKEVFNIPNQIGLKRKIYGYSVDSDMSLLFDEKDEEIIVMDHLFPSKPMYEGKAEYYVPDFSFDALRYKKGIWTYEEDYDARMPKNLKDRYYDMELPDQNKIY